MAGVSSYRSEEIDFVLRSIVRKQKSGVIMEEFKKKFERTLNPNQIRYIKNKYGKDPKYGSPLVNYKGNNARDLKHFRRVVRYEEVEDEEEQTESETPESDGLAGPSMPTASARATSTSTTSFQPQRLPSQRLPSQSLPSQSLPSQSMPSQNFSFPRVAAYGDPSPAQMPRMNQPLPFGGLLTPGRVNNPYNLVDGTNDSSPYLPGHGMPSASHAMMQGYDHAFMPGAQNVQGQDFPQGYGYPQPEAQYQSPTGYAQTFPNGNVDFLQTMQTPMQQLQPLVQATQQPLALEESLIRTVQRQQAGLTTPQAVAGPSNTQDQRGSAPPTPSQHEQHGTREKTPRLSRKARGKQRAAPYSPSAPPPNAISVNPSSIFINPGSLLLTRGLGTVNNAMNLQLPEFRYESISDRLKRRMGLEVPPAQPSDGNTGEKIDDDVEIVRATRKKRQMKKRQMRREAAQTPSQNNAGSTDVVGLAAHFADSTDTVNDALPIESTEAIEHIESAVATQPTEIPQAEQAVDDFGPLQNMEPVQNEFQANDYVFDNNVFYQAPNANGPVFGASFDFCFNEAAALAQPYGSDFQAQAPTPAIDPALYLYNEPEQAQADLMPSFDLGGTSSLPANGCEAAYQYDGTSSEFGFAPVQQPQAYAEETTEQVVPKPPGNLNDDGDFEANLWRSFNEVADETFDEATNNLFSGNFAALPALSAPPTALPAAAGSHHHGDDGLAPEEPRSEPGLDFEELEKFFDFSDNDADKPL